MKKFIKYPEIGGETIGETSSIPGLIRYIYLFALGIVGFTALLSIVIGAFQYTTSAGNPTAIKNAKDRIISAILGIILLLSAVLILNTINPDLVKFELTLPNSTPSQGPACYCFTGALGDSVFSRCYANNNDCNSNCINNCEGSSEQGGYCKIDLNNCK